MSYAKGAELKHWALTMPPVLSVLLLDKSCSHNFAPVNHKSHISIHKPPFPLLQSVSEETELLLFMLRLFSPPGRRMLHFLSFQPLFNVALMGFSNVAESMWAEANSKVGPLRSANLGPTKIR